MSVGKVKETRKSLPLEEQNEIDYIKNSSEWVLVSPRIMIGLVGTIAWFAWLFTMLGTSTYMPFTNLLGGSTLSVHICFLGGATVALAICWAASNFFSQHKIAHVVIAASLAAFGYTGFFFDDLQLIYYVMFSFSSGLGCGFLYVLYGEYICLFFKSDLKPYILGIFVATILVCAGILIAGPETSFVFSIIFPAVAIIAYVSQLIFFRLDKQPIISARVSDQRSQVVGRSYLATATAGMALGFALGCILSSQTPQSWVYILIVVGLFGTCLFLFIDSIRKNRVDEAVTMRLFLPFSAVVVFPMLFVVNEFRVVLAVLLLCGAIFPTTCSLSAMCQHIVLCKLSAIRAFSLGRLINFLGILLGMAMGLIGFSEVSVAQFGDLITSVVVIVFMVLVIFSASFVMIENNYPDRARFKEVAVESENGDDIALVATPGVPIRQTSTSSEKIEDEPKQNRPGSFYAKCSAVAVKYDLSNRQKEVLVMLAKGRNADYITKQLVISSHTAKAHIYNIYQKTGVHSRQELMDLVEEAQPDNSEDL